MKTTTLRTSFFVLAGLLALNSHAQNNPKKFGRNLSSEVIRCGTTEYEAMLQEKHPLRTSDQKFEQWLAPKVAEARAQRLAAAPQDANVVVTIPVVVHIIHNGDAVGVDENISEAQVMSQLTVLNQDFRRMLNTPGYNNNPVGADMEIEFCLAQRDPSGVASTGIIRYNMGTGQGWDMADIDETLKPQTQWDPEQYLNIWVVDNIYTFFGELAGYAQFPTSSGLQGLNEPGLVTTADTDGVVIGHRFFGSSEIYPAGTYDQDGGRDKGRTTTHEIGHFFGLRHIWGDGGCNVDDYCADTPAASQPNAGCEEGTDTCPSSPGLDMIENYMDYTFDDCQNIFTQDQKDRMMAVLANSPRRVALITSLGCVPGATYDNDGSLNLDSMNLVDCGTTFSPTVTLSNPGNTTISSAVIQYDIDGGTTTTYTWEGTLEQGEETTIEFDEMTASAGEHVFNAAIISVNGTEDGFEGNNTIENNFTIVSAFNTTQITVTVMTDNYGDETVWALLDSNEEPIVSNLDLENPLGSEFYGNNQLYTQTIDVENNQCYTFAILDFAADGICCTNGNGYYTVTASNGAVIAAGGEFGEMEMTAFRTDNTLSVNNPVAEIGTLTLYPNPANSQLTVNVGTDVQSGTYIIYNNLGQTLTSDAFSSDTFNVDVSGFTDGVYFINVTNGGTSKTMKFIKN